MSGFHYFQGAHDFTVNGGNFSHVDGSVTNNVYEGSYVQINNSGSTPNHISLHSHRYTDTTKTSDRPKSNTSTASSHPDINVNIPQPTTIDDSDSDLDSDFDFDSTTNSDFTNIDSDVDSDFDFDPYFDSHFDMPVTPMNSWNTNFFPMNNVNVSTDTTNNIDFTNYNFSDPPSSRIDEEERGRGRNRTHKNQQFTRRSSFPGFVTSQTSETQKSQNTDHNYGNNTHIVINGVDAKARPRSSDD